MWPIENIKSMYMPIFLDSAQLLNIIYQAYIVSHTTCAVMFWMYLQGIWCLHFARYNSMFVRQHTKIILAMQCFLSMTLVIVENMFRLTTKKHQSSTLMALCEGNPLVANDSTPKEAVMRKALPCQGAFMGIVQVQWFAFTIAVLWIFITPSIFHY